MEIKLPGTENKEQQYFKQLLAKIREIRKSELGPSTKIEEIARLAVMDDDQESMEQYLKLTILPQNMDYDASLRLANYVVFIAEGYAKNENVLTIKSLYEHVYRNLNDIKEEKHIYEFPSFDGDYVENEDRPEPNVLLPEELKDFKGMSMILKIMDMDRFVDTFCSRNTYYRRAYAILADLDKEILECTEAGEFPSWIDVPYKDDGDALFEFSHFELDLREPDGDYRTLYVVYRYDTTAS